MYLYKAIGSRLNQSVATTQTYTVPAGANGLMVQALTQNVRISFDANAPATASDGLQIKAGDPARLIPLAEGEMITAQQEAATAAFYVQPMRVWWAEWP